MYRTATLFGLMITVAALATAKAAAQQAPLAGDEEAAVRRVVDGIMQPYLAQRQRRSPRGQIWRRSPNLGAIVAVSLHGHRYFFPYGKATDTGAPFTRNTVVEIGSCTKTFTPRCSRWPSIATKSSLTIPLKNICRMATHCGRSN
jgi:CubicO group peptidase (beta-lactamase class C family)